MTAETPDTAARDALAVVTEVLGTHVGRDVYHPSKHDNGRSLLIGLRCLCGWDTRDKFAADTLHRAHVAAAVLDALGTGAGQAAVDALADLSATATPGLWRQEFYRDGELLPDGTGGMDDYVTPGSGVYVIDETSDEGYCLTEFSAGTSADAAFIVAAANYVRAAVTTADDATPSDQGGNEAGEGVGG